MKAFYIFLVLLQSSMIFAKDILIEAESFDLKGGWLVDPQFVEQMGSSYLLAHGLGKPVSDAQTSFKIEKNLESKKLVIHHINILLFEAVLILIQK